MTELSMRDAIRDALHDELSQDPNVFLLGEEIAKSGGVHGCTRDLLEKFGPGRVYDTPIAETGFAGLAIGAAMRGLRPVVEFMSFNFALLALDQLINTAAKARYMSAGQLQVPVVFRGPNGAAPFHGSQLTGSYEHLFTGIAGLKVVAPSTPGDANGLLKSAIRDNDPVIFLESEILYDLTGPVNEEEIIKIGSADIKREGTDLTIISWSKNVLLALSVASALAEKGVSVEVLDLRSLKPLDTDLIFNSVKKTNRALIIQEGPAPASFGAYLSHLINSSIFDELDAPVRLVASADAPLPVAKTLNEALQPSKEQCLAAARELL